METFLNHNKTWTYECSQMYRYKGNINNDSIPTVKVPVGQPSLILLSQNYL